VATTGEGIPALRQALEKFQAFGVENALSEQRRREHWRARLLELLRQSLFERVARERLRDGSIDRRVEEVLGGRRDPYSQVEEMVAEFTGESRKPA
jgi:putative protein kinase ArgK-like GTPase of G3E family